MGHYTAGGESGEKMSQEIVMSIISLGGTLCGSLLGIVASGRLTAYRIEQLEKKVEKHNNLVERMVVVEQSAKAAHKRLDSLGNESDN